MPRAGKKKTAKKTTTAKKVSAAKKAATNGTTNPSLGDVGGGPGHPVSQKAQAAVDVGSVDRRTVLTELGTSKTLEQVADSENLKIFNVVGGTPGSTAKIRKIVKNLSKAQQDLVRTAVIDAIVANRKVKYNCAVWDVKDVETVHFHIHVDDKTTFIEICPGSPA